MRRRASWAPPADRLVTTTFAGALLQVLVLNIVLSGDNAVVIGLASRNLPGGQRRRAILFGGAAAVLLRLILTIPAALLLATPYIRAAGGVLLGWVAYRLLDEGDAGAEQGPAETMMTAIRLIVVADVTMSLDNVLAVAAVAERSNHRLLVLVIGLALSIPVVLLGGGFVASLMHRLPWLAWLGAGVLAYTAAELFTGDKSVQTLATFSSSTRIAVAASVTAVVLSLAWSRSHRKRRRLGPPPPATQGGGTRAGHGADPAP